MGSAWQNEYTVEDVNDVIIDPTVPPFPGTDFAMEIISVYPGEDVTSKVLLFCQQEPRCVCIISANGAVSAATIRQRNTSGGTITYEGRYKLMSLNGSFLPNDTGGGPKIRSGGMTVHLAGPAGNIIGGPVAGRIVAASHIKVTVGHFVPLYLDKPKKQEPVSTSTSPVYMDNDSSSSSSSDDIDNWCIVPVKKSKTKSLPDGDAPES